MFTVGQELARPIPPGVHVQRLETWSLNTKQSLVSFKSIKTWPKSHAQVSSITTHLQVNLGKWLVSSQLPQFTCRCVARLKHRCKVDEIKKRESPCIISDLTPAKTHKIRQVKRKQKEEKVRMTISRFYCIRKCLTEAASSAGRIPERNVPVLLLFIESCTPLRLH